MQEINKTKSKYDCNKQDISIINGLGDWCPYRYKISITLTAKVAP